MKVWLVDDEMDQLLNEAEKDGAERRIALGLGGRWGFASMKSSR